MNVFYTNSCPVQSAIEHCNTHQVKMIVEYAQLLSTAHRVCGGSDAESIYKITHVNHPSAVWVRQSKANYNWVLTCAIELCHLYFLRTGKRHKTEEVLVELCAMPNIDCNVFSEPPAAVDDDLKALPVLTAYTTYLKRKFNEWATREDKRKIFVTWSVQSPSWI